MYSRLNALQNWGKWLPTLIGGSHFPFTNITTLIHLVCCDQYLDITVDSYTQNYHQNIILIVCPTPSIISLSKVLCYLTKQGIINFLKGEQYLPWKTFSSIWNAPESQLQHMLVGLFKSVCWCMSDSPKVVYFRRIRHRSSIESEESAQLSV